MDEYIEDPIEIMESVWERTEAEYCVDEDKGLWKCCNCNYVGPGEYFIFPGVDGCYPPVCEDCWSKDLLHEKDDSKEVK